MPKLTAREVALMSDLLNKLKESEKAEKEANNGFTTNKYVSLLGSRRFQFFIGVACLILANNRFELMGTDELIAIVALTASWILGDSLKNTGPGPTPINVDKVMVNQVPSNAVAEITSNTAANTATEIAAGTP